jgi:hypothetical protein
MENKTTARHARRKLIGLEGIGTVWMVGWLMVGAYALLARPDVLPESGTYQRGYLLLMDCRPRLTSCPISIKLEIWK